MDHTIPKGQRKNPHLTHGQEPLHGQKLHHVENGLLPGGHGKVGFHSHSLDQAQNGGRNMALMHHLEMQCPACPKNKVIVHGVPQATDSPVHKPLHHGDDQTWPMHHGIRNKRLTINSKQQAERQKDSKTQMRKAGGQKIQRPKCGRQEGKRMKASTDMLSRTGYRFAKFI